MGGGYINDVSRFAVKDDRKDIVSTLIYDRRDNIVKKIDAEANVFDYQYNAFHQCEREVIPVTPTTIREIAHQYDANNNKIATTTTYQGESSVVRNKYAHFLNVPTETTNAREARTRFDLDKLGRIKKIDIEVTADVFITDSKIAYDAFSQVIKTTAANDHTIAIEHLQNARLQVTRSAADGSEEIEKTNIFGETIETIDAEGNKETVRHTAHGAVKEHHVEDSVTITHHNLIGLVKETIDANGGIIDFNYNPAHQLVSKTYDKDAKGFNISTEYQRDAFGRDEAEIDARGILTKNEFDRNGQMIKAIRDPAGKALTTQFVRNLAGQELARIEGDEKQPDQLHAATEYDALGHISATIIDPSTTLHPDALNIRTEFKNDKAGNIVSVKDPNGNLTTCFYDLRNLKNVEVKQINTTEYAAQEWTYSKTGKITCQRAYHAPLEAKSVLNAKTIAEAKTLNGAK